MNKIFFTLGLLLASNAFAATGTGHSQAELTQPLSIVNQADVTFQTIAIDPAAGAQTVFLVGGGACPATYVCSGSASYGQIILRGAIDTDINVSIEGSTAILSDGAGQTLLFDPLFVNDLDTYAYNLGPSGAAMLNVKGSIDFTGNEVAGSYSSTNAGGSGYTVTVNY